MLTHATLESARFGLRAFRATLHEVDTARLFAEILAQEADLVILRVPPRESGAIRNLARYGLAPIHADTLVSYVCDLQATRPAAAEREGSTIDVAHEDDRSAIADLVDTVFAEYPSHYTANPLLARADVVAGYREWALSHLQSDDRVAWVARVSGQVAAIACSSFDAATGQCQGVLHGVHPHFVRGGIYKALIRHTQRSFRTLGYKHLTIQTQAWNMPVQRVWVREGFVLNEVFETFHVNALFGPKRDTRHLEVNFPDSSTPELPARLMQAVAKAMEQPGSISQRAQMMAAVAVFEPVAADQKCTLEVRTYALEQDRDSRMVVGILYDPGRRLCATVRATIPS